MFVGNGMLSTAAIIGGVIIVGIAHGFINAPVVTHVAHSRACAQIGANPVTTTYRFLERIGPCRRSDPGRPILPDLGTRPAVLVWIGIATAILGLLFVVTAPARRGRTSARRLAR